MRCLAVSIPFLDFLIADTDGVASLVAMFALGMPGRIDDDGVGDK